MSGIRFTDAERAEIIRLYTVENWGVDKIGMHLRRNSGVSVWRFLKARNIPIRGGRFDKVKRTSGSLEPGSIKKREYRARTGSQISAFASAVREAALFTQPSLIGFPESPQLQADWDAIMATVKQERGAEWRTITGARA